MQCINILWIFKLTYIILGYNHFGSPGRYAPQELVSMLLGYCFSKLNLGQGLVAPVLQTLRGYDPPVGQPSSWVSWFHRVIPGVGSQDLLGPGTQPP